jgi:hypothetical protein
MSARQDDAPVVAEEAAESDTASTETSKAETLDKPAVTSPKPLDVLPNVPSPHYNSGTKRQLLAVAAVIILAMIAISVFMLLRNSG